MGSPELVRSSTATRYASAGSCLLSRHILGMLSFIGSYKQVVTFRGKHPKVKVNKSDLTRKYSVIVAIQADMSSEYFINWKEHGRSFDIKYFVYSIGYASHMALD